MEKTILDFIEPIVIAEMSPLTWENVNISALRYGEYMRSLGRYEGWEHAASDIVIKMGYAGDNFPTNPYRKGETG